MLKSSFLFLHMKLKHSFVAPEPQLMLTAGPGMIGTGYQSYAPPMPGYQGYGM